MLSTLLVAGSTMAVGLVACAGYSAGRGGSAGAALAMRDAQVPPTAGALVLDKDQLERERGRSVLEAIRVGLPGVRIGVGDRCPTVGMRAPLPLATFEPPTVYVDGAASVNTCILQDLPVDDVARIEVYRSGFTARPGYVPNPSGLILVFTRRGTEDQETLDDSPV